VAELATALGQPERATRRLTPGLAAAWVARCVGLLKAMVFTHLPSNVLLLLVPLMPDLGLAVTVLLLRFSISHMDVPTRQSYTVAVVSPDERSAAAGVTGVARSLGSAVSPMLATALIGVPSLAGVPFLLAGASRSSTTCCSTAGSPPSARPRSAGLAKRDRRARAGQRANSKRPRPRTSPATARVTNKDKAGDCRARNRAEAITQARRLLAEGHSKREVARHLGVADCTLRTWLKKQKEVT
jgi:hypothetical protein